VALLTCVALAGLPAAASAHGGALSSSPKIRPISIFTNENPASPGSFELVFGGLGFTTTSGITSTQFTLEVDHLRRKARFVQYLQHVEPLILPGGLSTGDITVRIVEGSSTGTYEPLTRTFTTSEQYAVHFTGDLSAFGLTSPVVLPSTSTGVVATHPVQDGTVTMDWQGDGQLANPSNPSNPLDFTYTCRVNTVYPPASDSQIAVGLSSDVMILQLAKPFENILMSPLNFALFKVQQGKKLQAVVGLQVFKKVVKALSGSKIAKPEADELISTAKATISLLLGS
jgi:hypothetical protein